MANKQMIDAMWDDSPVDVSTEVNFIWSIANKLRGPYRSDKYKDVTMTTAIPRRKVFSPKRRRSASRSSKSSRRNAAG